MIYLEDLREYLKELVPQIWRVLGFIIFIISIIIIIKFIISKIPKIGNKKIIDWGLTEDEIKYIYDGQKEDI